MRMEYKELSINGFDTYKRKQIIDLDRELKEYERSKGRWFTPKGNYEKRLFQ